MNSMNTFKVGDKAYFEEIWSENLMGGRVIEVGMTEATEKNPSEQWVKIQIEGTRYQKEKRLSSQCYPTREAAMNAQKAENERICGEYRARIRTVEDLVQFMYDHNVNTGAEEYTDWNARNVAREKAEELLEIELEH